MKFLLASIFCLSVYSLLRAFSFFLTHIDLHGYRDLMCIERIVKQQKACDKLNSVYQAFVILISTHFTFECVLLFSNMDSIRVFNISSLIVISISYITYFILRFKMETKYHLGNFYSHMIDYRSKQKVVTQDNDNEVTYIRSYQKVMKHKRNINILYLAALAALAALLYIFH